MKSRIKPYLPTVFLDFFTSGVERSVKAKKNILYSFGLKGISIVINLLLVPITIDYVNPTRYGIWLTLSSVIGWMSFFDIGLGNGFRNKFTQCVASGKYKLARIYVSTTYAILSIIIGVILILFLIVNPFLNWEKILNTSSIPLTELSTLALLVFVFFCIQFILNLLITLLTANQEPSKASFLNVLANVISLVIIFLLTRFTEGNLVYLGVVLSASPVIVLLISSFWFFSKSYKDFRPSLRFIHFGFAGNLMNLGVKFFFIQVAGIIIYCTHNIIISNIFGPELVTPYNIAFKYFNIITILFSIILSPFWSAITDAYTLNDVAWIRRAMRKLMKISISLMIFVFIMVQISDPVYRFWVGGKVSVPFDLSLLMGIYFCLTLFLQPFTFFINGTGKIKLQLIQSILVAVVNIPLSILFCKNLDLGISGIILATILCYLPGCILTPLQYFKIVRGRATGIWNE